MFVAHGADDAFVPPQQLEDFKKEMAATGADFTIKTYPGAVHSFTNPQADRYGIEGVRYNQTADDQSWKDMAAFLSALFGAEAKSAKQPGQ